MTLQMALSLIHSVWEIALIAMLACIIFAMSRSPRVRYGAGVVALAAMIAAPVATFAWIAAHPQPVRSTFAVPSGAPAGGPEGLSRSDVRPSAATSFAPVAWVTNVVLTWTPSERTSRALLFVWMTGVVLLSLRLASGLRIAQSLTRHGGAAPSAAVIATFDRLVLALKISRPVAVIESAMVHVPSVIGAMKPVVLLPAAAMSGLSMSQIEALLAHELAHIRRHDYLVNLLQSAIETVLFYHPAVWLVSRRVRRERELCCDDMALAVCGDRVTYASALAEVESMRVLPAPALAATGGSLAARVRRILGDDQARESRGATWASGVLVLTVLIALVSAQTARATQVPTRTTAASAITLPTSETTAASSAQSPAAQSPRRGGILAGERGGTEVGKPAGVSAASSAGVIGGIRVGVESGASTQTAASAIDESWSSFVLQADDVIAVNVFNGTVIQDFARRPFQIARDGSVSLPFLQAPVKIVGMTIREAEAAIANVLQRGKIFDAPTVHVTVLEYHKDMAPSSPPTPSGENSSAQTKPVPVKTVSFQIQGSIQFPGEKTIAEDRATLVNVITDAGGLTANASDTIRVRGTTGIEINYKRADILTSTNLATVRVAAGDVITVLPQVPPQPAPKPKHVYVNGQVKGTGFDYLWTDGMTLGDAIELAGGLAPDGASNRIQISRADANGVYHDIKMDGDRMKVKLEPGDVVNVPKRRM